MSPRFGLGFLLVGAMLTGEARAAGAVCAPRATLLEVAAKRYGEQPVSAGLGSDGWLIEVLSSAEGRSFTILRTAPSGISCVAASGEGWRDLPPPDTGDPGA